MTGQYRNKSVINVQDVINPSIKNNNRNKENNNPIIEIQDKNNFMNNSKNMQMKNNLNNMENNMIIIKKEVKEKNSKKKPNPIDEFDSPIAHVSYFTRTIIDIHDLDHLLEKETNHGICGSYKLNNCSYVNSSIACISNCTELTTYFLTNKYTKNIIKSKKDPYHKLAGFWYDLLKEFWETKTKAGNVSKIKEIMDKEIKKYGRRELKDSNEFITEFLDFLNEGLNKSIKKNIKN